MHNTHIPEELLPCSLTTDAHLQDFCKWPLLFPGFDLCVSGRENVSAFFCSTIKSCLICVYSSIFLFLLYYEMYDVQLHGYDTMY